jgi:hypothetical protein
MLEKSDDKQDFLKLQTNNFGKKIEILDQNLARDMIPEEIRYKIKYALVTMYDRISIDIVPEVAENAHLSLETHVFQTCSSGEIFFDQLKEIQDKYHKSYKNTVLWLYFKVLTYAFHKDNTNIKIYDLSSDLFHEVFHTSINDAAQNLFPLNVESKNFVPANFFRAKIIFSSLVISYLSISSFIWFMSELNLEQYLISLSNVLNEASKI